MMPQSTKHKLEFVKISKFTGIQFFKNFIFEIENVDSLEYCAHLQEE